jgi:DNA-binding protein Fis
LDIQTPASSGAAEAAQTARHRAPRGETIEQCVQRSLDDYFAQLDGSRPHALLGINRNTLRKKLQHYGLA